ncbi:Zinc finger C2H2 [Penicillium malachiteum]|uniref:Zinc finger C2H2 n=1 Tax=Penicillium malachiteum TaxID=1324776 RepID=A0AAD6HS60_9EURO|nr:Zinc finger C2H2 [Penicillium malachiteum]
MEDLLEDLNTSLLHRIQALHHSTEDGIVRQESESVEAILDQLFRFSRAVRRSGILHRLVKIANNVEYDADGVNLTATFQAGISRLVEHYLKGCSASEELRDRLVETICLRRRNFSYLKAQRESRSSNKPTKIPTQAASRARSTLTSSFSITMPLPTTARKMKPINLDPIFELGRPVMTATTAQIDDVPIDHSIQSSVGADQQQRSTEEDGLELPQPPEIPFGVKEWECHYCLMVCPVKEFNPENWISKKDWLDHMKKEHTTQSWTCLDPTHETKLSFKAQDEFEQHMRDEHEGQFEEADLEDLVEACFESKITSITFTECPFCPKDTNMDTISKAWTQHLAQHLLSFSRLSFDGYLENDDQESDVSKSIGSSNVSGPQVLSRTIADGLREMRLDADEHVVYYADEEDHFREGIEKFTTSSGTLALDSDQHYASRDPIEEDEDPSFKLDISSLISEFSTTSEVPETPSLPAQPVKTIRDTLREIYIDAEMNDEQLIISPAASEISSDTGVETWAFCNYLQNLNQYDAASDPILKSFSKKFVRPEEKLSNSSSPVMSGLNPAVPASEGPDKDHSTTAISAKDLIIKSLQRWDRIIYADIPFLTSEGSPLQWRDEIERFRLWTTDIGAHRTGNLSLDYRLKNSPDIKEQILWHLINLEKPMSAIVPQATHDGSSEISPGPGSFSSRGSVLSTYELLRATIDGLFQLSLFLEQRSEIASFEPFDKQHVKEKYPLASEEIANRLGLTNSLRRFVMRHRKRQNLMLDRGLDQISNSKGDGTSSHSSHTIEASPGEVAVAERDDLEGHLPSPPIPLPPRDSSRAKITECPYCSSIIAVKSTRDWTRHIFNDLLPYVCIYPKCSVPQQMFRSRRAWFHHMESQHSIKDNPSSPLNCTLCLPSLLPVNFEEHVGRHLEELALFALPYSEDDEYDTESASSDAGLTHDVLLTTHENPDGVQDQIEPPIPSDENSQKSSPSESIQRCPVCDKSSSDMRSHILAHQIGGPEKCPDESCEYHITGFIDTHDKYRHVWINHYKITFECDFCKQSGILDGIQFSRSPDFEKHLISVHGVSPHLSKEKYTNEADVTPGRCYMCNRTYLSPQLFYYHLEKCLVQQTIQNYHQLQPKDAPLRNQKIGNENDSKILTNTAHGLQTLIPLVEESYETDGSSPDSSAQAQHIAMDGELSTSLIDKSSESCLATDTHNREDHPNPKPQADVNAKKPTTCDASTNTPSSRGSLVPGLPNSNTDEGRPDIIYLRHKLRKNPEYIGNLHALLFGFGEIEGGIVTIGQLRAAAAVRLRASSPGTISMLHNGKALSYDLMSCQEAGLEHTSEVLCAVTNEGPNMQSQIANPGITIDRNQPQARNKIGQNVAKAEDESVPSSAPGSIPKIPDLSSMSTSLEKVTACKSYFQQELVPICLLIIDDFPPTATAKYHFDNRLMRVFDTHLKLLEMLNGIDHGSDIESINAYQTLISQVKRALEQLIGARDN